MKVALYCDCNSRAGVWAYTCSLAAALRGQGVGCVVISHPPDGPLQSQLLESLRECSDELVVLPAQAGGRADLSSFVAALRAVAPDVYLPNYRSLPFAAGALCTATTRMIACCHATHESYYHLFRRYSSAVSSFVAPVEAARAALTGLFPDRADDIVLIPHGVRASAGAAPRFDGGTFRLIYFGRLAEQQKQTGLLLDLMRELTVRGEDVHLQLVGDGAQVDEYVRRIAQQELGRRVTLSPSVEWPTLERLLSDSHAFVLTSAFEGFCLSLAEAMAAGLPGLAMRCGGVIEEYLIDGETGFLCEQGDVAMLADRVAVLRHDPALWRSMSVRARELVRQRYQWDATAARYVKEFERVMARPASRLWPTLRPALAPADRSVGWAVDRLGSLLGAW